MQWAVDILKQYWGYDGFRGVQEKVIESVSQGKDTLGLMPTGGGKSICFQVPALAMDGLCIVVTPLISLMKDQVRQLKARGIKAETVYSGMTRSDIVRVLDNCVLGDYKFLYLSPERLASELFLAKLVRFRKVSMIVVDEAHCVSQWGYDFRPSYLQIANIRHIIPYPVPVLALTATATPKVVEDIQERLEFKKKNVFSMSFERKNLIYVVRETDDKQSEILHILDGVKEGSAIIYVRSRQMTSEIANMLNDNGVTALAYHAGLTNAEKDLRQAIWTKDRVRVMVATNAFGMGIDKADVRIVIHFSLPDSIEAYFQEAGRAGRDGRASYAVLLYSRRDTQKLAQRVAETYPDEEYVRKTYENACYFLQVGIGEAEGRTFYFPLDTFCRTFKQFPVQTNSALNLLNNAGYIEWHEEQEFLSALRFVTTKEELYRLHDNDEVTDKVIQAVLRNYTGVFADFVYVEETLIAHATGLTSNQVYQTLKSLHHNRIIDFIPHRKTPTLTFTMPRVDTERIVLGKDVYEDRLEDYKQRIEQISAYASSKDQCRSAMMLRYFGDKEAKDCGMCDVCLAKKRITNEKERNARKLICECLKDRESHLIAELQKDVQMDSAVVAATLREMVREEIVIVEGSKVRLA